MDEHHPYDDNSGYGDFIDSDDAFRNAKTRANHRGHDLHFRLPVAFAESITGANKRLTGKFSVCAARERPVSARAVTEMR